MDPQQELFSKIKIELENKGYDVYDGALPQNDTPYPFVYLGDMQQIDDANKSAVFGNVYQAIHVWHNNYNQRGTVSSMLLDIKQVCRMIDKTNNFEWMILNINQRIISDTTTKTPLLHGILELEFKFS